MKRLLMVLILLALMVPFAQAEQPLGSTDYNALVELRDSINMTLWTAYDWREIIVQRGQYVVGQDFPAGTYRLSAPLGERPMILVKTVEEGASVDMYAHVLTQEWVEPEHGSVTEYTFTEGQFLDISMGAVTFLFDSYIPGFSAFSAQRKESPLAEYTALYNVLLDAIKQCEQWEEVPVYPGVWAVGTQIPVGRWSIFPSSGKICGVHYSQNIDDDGTIYNNAIDEAIKSPSKSSFDADVDLPYYSIDAREGYYIGIEMNSVIFTPYVGKPLFIFKAE